LSGKYPISETTGYLKKTAANTWEVEVLISITSVTSDATPNPIGSSRENEYYLTALAEAAEFAAPSGTPVNGNTLLIRIKDTNESVGMDLTWNTIYKGFAMALPSITIPGKEMYLGFIYNSASSKWDLVSKCDEI